MLDFAYHKHNPPFMTVVMVAVFKKHSRLPLDRKTLEDIEIIFTWHLQR